MSRYIVLNVSEAASISSPLSFKHIRFEHKQYSIDNLLTLMRYGTIAIKNEREWKKGTWNALEMSRYIESIWLRLPLQPLYFDSAMPQWLVIDGYQRLRTLQHFVRHTEPDFKEIYKTDFPDEQVPSPLRLEGLQFFTQWNGHTFDQLPLSWRRRILEGMIMSYVQSLGTDHTVRQAIFERLQPFAKPIDAQLAFFVSQTESMYPLLTRFTNQDIFVATLQLPLDDFATYELTLRGLASLCFPYQQYTQHIPFLMDTLYTLSRIPRPQLRTLQNQFTDALHTANGLFGKAAFSLSSAEPQKIYATLFDVWLWALVQLNEYANTQTMLRTDTKTLLINHFNTLLSTDPVFVAAITSETQTKEHVIYRFEAINNIINQIKTHNSNEQLY